MKTTSIPEVPNAILTSTTAPGDHATLPSRIVLRPWQKNEYVTHMQCSDGGFNHGHYFDNFESAVVDYLARTKELRVHPQLTDEASDLLLRRAGRLEDIRLNAARAEMLRLGSLNEDY